MNIITISEIDDKLICNILCYPLVLLFVIKCVFYLTFRGMCIVIYSYNKTNEMHQFHKFIFGIELCMFRTGFLSVIRRLVLCTQQQVYVIQVMLTACQQAVSITCLYCCVYNARLMVDRETVRNMQSSIPKINLRNQCISLVLL